MSDCEVNDLKCRICVQLLLYYNLEEKEIRQFTDIYSRRPPSFQQGLATPQSRPASEWQFGPFKPQTYDQPWDPSSSRPVNWSLASGSLYARTQITKPFSAGDNGLVYQQSSRLLSLLRDFGPFRTLLETYWKVCEPSVILAPLIMEALPSVQATLGNNLDDGSLEKRLVENTSRPFRVPTSITASNFHSLYTGENLRWEFLGTLFAMAGLAAQLTCSQHPTCSPNNANTNKSQLITCALEASNRCIAICQNYNCVNDIMLWLLSTNLLLLCNVRGDSGKFSICGPSLFPLLSNSPSVRQTMLSGAEWEMLPQTYSR